MGKQHALMGCVLVKFLGVVGYARGTWGLDPSLAKGMNKARANEGGQDKPKPPNDGEPLTLTFQVSFFQWQSAAGLRPTPSGRT